MRSGGEREPLRGCTVLADSGNRGIPWTPVLSLPLNDGHRWSVSVCEYICSGDCERLGEVYIWTLFRLPPKFSALVIHIDPGSAT